MSLSIRDSNCFFGNTYLCVVPRPSFVRVRTPLLVFGPRSGREEGYIVLCVASAVFVAAPITGSRWRIEIQSHFYRAVWCRMFWAAKMEHANRFGIQKTENLEGKKKYMLNMLQDTLHNNMKCQLLYVIRKVGKMIMELKTSLKEALWSGASLSMF